MRRVRARRRRRPRPLRFADPDIDATSAERTTAPSLGTWLDDAPSGPFASFARGLRDDRRAIRAALSLPWSNGRTEGRITRLELVRRRMYGRAKPDLLGARLIGAA